MLNKIRKIADSAILKVIMGFLVLALLIPLLQSINTRSESTIVEFKYAKIITQQDFIQSYEKSKLALGHKIEDKNQLQTLKMHVLNNLIQERLLNTLPGIYDLAISDSTLKDLLTQIPELLNEEGKLNITKLQQIAHENHISENQLLNNVTNDILQSFIIQTLLQSYTPPKILTEILAKNAKEIYHLELISIDSNSTKLTPKPSIERKYLEDFHEQHNNLFSAPEKRSFDYVYINLNDLMKNITISKNEASDYIAENPEEFNNQTNELKISKAKDILRNIQLTELLVKLNLELEDEIASGGNLLDISKKFNTPLKKIVKTSLSDCKNEIYGEYADLIFDSNANEISSPIEVLNGKGLVIFEVKTIVPSYIPELKDIELQVTNMWLEEYYQKSNISFLENLALEKLNKYSNIITYDKNYKLNHDSKDFSPKIIFEIMNLKKGEKTKVFSNELKTKLYVAWVKDISYMQNVTKIDAEKILENALNKINYGLLEELLNYLHKINKVKVNTKNLIFTSDF